MMKAKEFVARRQTIGEFAEQNRKDLERIASYILKRWPAPNDMGVEDVVQELLLACWRDRLKFDPSRGKSAESFVSFNAISRAKRQVHKARRARGDRGIGTFEVLTQTGTVDQEMRQWNRHDSEETETAVERRDRLRELIERCNTTREAICLFVFYEEEDTKAAGQRIYSDASLRKLCGINSAAAAQQIVKQVAKEHACHA